MNKKIAFIAFPVLAIFAFTVWAVTTNGPVARQHAGNTVNIEQVSGEATMPAHCEPSNCTPEEAAKCPYSHSASATAASNQENSGNCPMTNECPPSKCNGEKAEQTKATL